MKKPSSRIREDIARLQEQLRYAETREAERIGRIALKAGLGEFDIDDAELHRILQDAVGSFRKDYAAGSLEERGRKPQPEGNADRQTTTVTAGTLARHDDED